MANDELAQLAQELRAAAKREEALKLQASRARRATNVARARYWRKHHWERMEYHRTEAAKHELTASRVTAHNPTGDG